MIRIYRLRAKHDERMKLARQKRHYIPCIRADKGNPAFSIALRGPISIMPMAFPFYGPPAARRPIVKVNAFWAALSAMLLAVATAGCDPAGRGGIERRLASEQPQERASAARDLVQSNAPDTDIRLIHLLADPDEGGRFFAAAALYRRTGERFGYKAEAPLREREASIAQYVQWYCQKHPDAAPQFEGLMAGMKTLDPNAPSPGGEGASS